MIYIIDFYDKIVSNFLRFSPAAVLAALVLTLLYRKILRKDRWISFFFFCGYLVLLVGETLLGRLGENITTGDMIGISSLFENPWYMVAAVENIIMFIPFGLLFVRVVPSEKVWLGCLIASFLVSIGIESIQYILHIGEAQLVDVLANLLGAALGMLLSVIVSMKQAVQKL